jgi:hypothetical protein
MPDGGDYSMTKEEFDRRFPSIFSGDVPEEVCYCNYCVNHWGLDLCGCGSGEKFGECGNGYYECQRPAQSMEDGITSCSCEGAWA